MKKVLITTPTFGKFSDEPMKLLREAGFSATWYELGASPEDVLAEIVDADAVINGQEAVTTKCIERAERLKVISKHGVGLDNIDLIAANEKGIRVVNAKGTNTDAVADLAILLGLAVARKLNTAQSDLDRGRWTRVVGHSMWGATMGIVGFGAIGKGVARRAKGFGMRILAYDILWDENLAAEYGVERCSLEALLEQADYVTLHCALTEENRHMIGMPQLKKMKPHAVLINTARGGLIREADLYEALLKGVIFGAGLDTFEEEPSGRNPLFELENVVKSPHMGAYTENALTQMSLTAAQNVIKYA